MKFENDYGQTTRGRTQNSNISCQLENAPLSRQINSKKRTWVAEEDPFLGLRVDVVTVAEQTQGVDIRRRVVVPVVGANHQAVITSIFHDRIMGIRRVIFLREPGHVYFLLHVLLPLPGDMQSGSRPTNKSLHFRRRLTCQIFIEVSHARRTPERPDQHA